MKKTRKSTPDDSILHDLKVAGGVLRAAHSRGEVLDLTIKFFLKLGFDRVRIWITNRDCTEFHGAACSYIPTKDFEKIKSNSTLKPYTLSKIRADKKEPFLNKINNFLKTTPYSANIKESYGFPLVAGNQPIGIISVDNLPSGRPLLLTTFQKSTAMAFANYLALVLDKFRIKEKLRLSNKELKQKVDKTTTELAERNAKLEYLVNHDELTRLPNRRDFDRRLALALKKASSKKPLNLAMIDVDFLKQVNDQKGHLAGDKMLINVAKYLKEENGIAYAARFAGDEFVVLIPDKQYANASKPLAKVAEKIKASTGYTISIGLACYPSKKVHTGLELIRAADDALYHSKHTGRNRLVWAESKTERVLPASERAQELRNLAAGSSNILGYLDQLKAVNEISRELQAIESETDLLQKVLRTFRQRLQAERIRVYLVDEVTKSLYCIFAVGIARAVWQTLTLPLDPKRSIGAEAVLQKKVIDIPDVYECKNFDRRALKLIKTRAVVIIPLIVKNKVIGILVADYKPEKIQFLPEQHSFLFTLGNYVAVALRQTRLLQEIKGLNHGLQTRISEATSRLQEYSKSLEQKVEDNRRLREEERQAHFDTVSALVVSIESNDKYTRGHSTRVARLAHELGKAVGLNKSDLADLRYASLLHDLGKVAVDRRLLNKGRALTQAEAKELSIHPDVGAKIVSRVSFLQNAIPLIRHHHERWDGRGYPDKLAGEAIPLGARIINIVDSFDAMTSRRSYGSVLSQTEAMRELQDHAGNQFDPNLVKMFVKIIKKKRQVSTPTQTKNATRQTK